MKKKLWLSLIIVFVVMICGCFIAACGGADDLVNQLNLTAPQNVRYDGATISWSPVEDAGSYSVKINDGSEYPITVPSFPYNNTENAQFNVSVKAIGKINGVESEATVKTFSPLPSVASITAQEDGTLVWEPVTVESGSLEYILKVDGKELPPVTVTEYAIDSLGEGRHTVQVRPSIAGNDSYYAKWSGAKTVTVLGAVNPEKVTYSDGLLKWAGVQNAATYDVYINDQLIEQGVTGTSVEFDAQNTSFDVTIKACGNGTTTFDGETSQAKSFVYLATITDVKVEDGIVKWDEVEKADGYKIKINGTVQSATLKDNLYDKLRVGQNNDIQIMPISTDATYFSAWSAVKSVLILEAPIIKWNSDYELDGDANSNAYWDAISNAAGYSVRLTLPDGTQQVESFSETQRAYQQAYLQTGKYTVEVKANSETASSNVYDSNYSTPIYVTRLASPKPVDRNYITSTANDVTKGFTVTFQSVAGASEYLLTKDNNEVLRSTTSQFNVGNVLDANITAEQTFNYAIRCLGGVKTVNNAINVTLGSLSSEALPFEIKVLATPATPDISGYEYTYGSVNGSNGYSINVQSQKYSSDNTNYDLKVLEAGVYDVSVCAKGNGSNVLASNYSQPIKVNRLNAPTNIHVETSDASEGVLAYNTVQFASGYEVIFDNNSQAVPVDTIRNMNQYVTEQGTTVSMLSTANYFNDDKTIYYMTSEPSVTENMIKLSAPTFGDVAFSNSQFIWKAPANMNTSVYTPTYEVYAANGTKYNGEKNGTTMDISYLEGGAEYTFYVKAVGNGTNYINSEKSTAINIYKLSTPGVTRSEGKYVWDSVVDATSYVVRVDGEIKKTCEHVAGTSYEFVPQFDELKTYTVEVIAIGDNGYTTIDSKACVIEQETKQLSTPAFTFGYSEKSYSNTGTIDVTITEQPAYANGYSYTVGGVTNTSKETTYSHLPSSVGSFSVRVYALGGLFDENGVYYLDSQSEGGSSAYTITLLACPNESSIELSQDGKLTWTPISGAVGYELEIAADGTEYGEVITVSNQSSYVISGFSQYKGKSLRVRLRAKGNGTKIISSVTVEHQWDSL